MEMEKGFDLVVRRWAWSQLRLYQQTKRGGGMQSHCWRGSVPATHPPPMPPRLLPVGSHLQGRQNPFPWHRPCPTLLWLHKSSQNQMVLSLDIPAMPFLILQWPHTFILYSTIVGIRRQSSPERQVSCCLRNFLQAAPGTFHKKANHMVTVQQSELKPPLETHQTDFVSPGF